MSVLETHNQIHTIFKWDFKWEKYHNFTNFSIDCKTFLLHKMKEMFSDRITMLTLAPFFAH